MAGKHKPKAPTVEHNPNALVIGRKKGQTDAEAMAGAVLHPCVNAAMTIKGCSTPSFGELDLTALVGELSAQAKLAKGGSLERVEETLLTQAHTLDALFNHLTRLSLSNTRQPHRDGSLHASWTQGAVSMPDDAGGPGGDQEPEAGCLHQTGQPRPGSAADQQRR